MNEGCNARLAPDQWWRFCGETDMGQTLPALCEHCGGEYIRADDQDAERKVAELNKRQIAALEERRKKDKQLDWVRGEGDWILIPGPDKQMSVANYATDSLPSFIMFKKFPTPARRLARRIREKIDLEALGLTDDQAAALSEMIDAAAEHSACYLRSDLEDFVWKEALKL